MSPAPRSIDTSELARPDRIFAHYGLILPEKVRSK